MQTLFCIWTIVWITDISNFNRCSAVHLPPDRKSVDVSDEYKGNGKYEPLKEQQTEADVPDNLNVNTGKPEKPASPTIAKDHLKGFTKGKVKMYGLYF